MAAAKDPDGRCVLCYWFDVGSPNAEGYFAIHHHTPTMAVYIDGYVTSEDEPEEWQQWKVFIAQAEDVVEIREDAEQLYEGDDFDMAWFIYGQWKQRLEEP